MQPTLLQINIQCLLNNCYKMVVRYRFKAYIGYLFISNQFPSYLSSFYHVSFWSCMTFDMTRVDYLAECLVTQNHTNTTGEKLNQSEKGRQFKLLRSNTNDFKIDIYCFKHAPYMRMSKDWSAGSKTSVFKQCDTSSFEL